MTWRDREREAEDRQDWIDGLRRRWGLVTAEGLPPTEQQSESRRLALDVGRGLLSIDDARRELGLDPWGLPGTAAA